MLLRVWFKLRIVVETTSLRVYNIWGQIRVWTVGQLALWILEAWWHFLIVGVRYAWTAWVQKALIWSHWWVLHVLSSIDTRIATHVVLLLMRTKGSSIGLLCTRRQIVLIYKLRVHGIKALISLVISS